jgi:hypothetical protein
MRTWIELVFFCAIQWRTLRAALLLALQTAHFIAAQAAAVEQHKSGQCSEPDRPWCSTHTRSVAGSPPATPSLHLAARICHISHLRPPETESIWHKAGARTTRQATDGEAAGMEQWALLALCTSADCVLCLHCVASLSQLPR